MTTEDNTEIQMVKRPTATSKSSESRKVESILSKCSCPECDSLKCFIRRSPANNLCNCPKKSKSCCNKHEKAIVETKPKLDIDRVISKVNKTVDICTKVSYHKTFNSENGTVDTIIQSSISCKSIAQDSYKSQESFSDIDFAMNPLQTFSENTAHLSAQIMKAGCIQDFNDYISLNEPYKESVAEINNMKEYIYRKLKEIYNACSCKVCECIPTTPFSARKSTCSCKPCQCDDCKLYSYVGSHLNEKPHVGCPCISCDRKDCRGVVKKSKKTCNCKPCDCLVCTESLSKNCNCAPCACFECKYKPSYLTRSFIVAAVGQNNRSNTCNCDSPCECSNCIPTYGTTGLSQERSTGTVTRSNCPCNSCMNQSCQSDGENCRCETQKHIMSKPIERGHHDYDIRNVLLEDTDIIKNNYNRDVISMSANVHQKFCMGDDPYQCLQRENRFSTQYIQLSLPNKICRYSYHAIPCHNKTSNFTYNTGDCLDSALANDSTSSFNQITPKKQPELLFIESITHKFGQSNQNVRTCQVETSKQSMNSGIVEVNHFATAQNSKINVNIKNKLKRKNTELLLSQRKNLYCVASILKNFSLFSEGSNSLCNEGNIERLSSLNMLLPVTPDSEISAENLNSLDIEECNIKKNYFRNSSTLPFFNTHFDEKERESVNEEPKFFIDTFDYDKIQKTLFQAQEFSTKLRGVLESYEAANDNFRSISHTLRKLYDEIINNSTSENKTYKVHFEHNKNPNKLYYVGDRISLTNETDSMGNNYNPSLTTCPSSNSNKTTLKPNLGSHNLLENVEYVKSCDEDIFADAISNFYTRFEFNYSYSTINDASNAFKRQRSPSDICNKLTSISIRKSNKYTETDFLQFHQNITFSKSTCTDKRHQDENFITKITFRDADFYKDEITETNITDSLHTNFIDIVLPSSAKLKNHEESKYQHWNVLRKNIFLDSGQKQNDNSDILRLEVNLKEFIRIISQEIRKEFIQQDNCMSYQRSHKVLRKKTHENVRTILDKVVSMVVLKSELNTPQRKSMISIHNLDLVKSKTFNQENKKASFSDIKRISDHTVLVKWNIPNNISNILGYELQIDGRAVKNIYNPHCAMAVINSLPQSERVLLTILTITDSEGPYSSNTIVYSPCNKTQ